MRRLKLTSGARDFANLKELREFRGELAETIQTLATTFDSRKAKRDEGQDVPLWEADEEQRFNHANEDLATVDAAIAEENRALEIAAARAQAGTLPPDRSPLSSGTPGERGIVVPARARAYAGRLKAFPNDEDGYRDAYAAGQYALMLAGNEPARAWCRDHLPEESRTAMSAANVGAGGILVPSGMSNNIIRLVEQYGVAAANCEVVPMATDTLTWPRRTGGVTLYAVGENSAITESNPTFDGINLTARKWAALVKYPTELEESAVINIGDFLTQECAWAWAKKLDDSVFIGDGTNTYHGIVGIKSALTSYSEKTAATANTAFSTLDLADFEAMAGMLATWAERSGRAKWYISKPGWAASMMRLADAAGGNTTATIADGSSRTMFLGYPVVWVPSMNSTLTAQNSTESLAILGDLMSGVTIGMRRDIRMAVARERYIEYDQVGFFMTVRFDVNVHDIGTSTQAGGIIQLNTPSS